jgi:hypothetical protein
MISFQEFLNEGKYGGIKLYHVTSYKNLIKIIYSDKLIIGSTGAISFTRNQNLLRQATVGLGGVGCVLEIDGEKLSNKFKIQPYSYHNLDVDVGDESEERILNRNVDNISKYMLGIRIYRAYFPEPNSRENMILCRLMGTGEDSVSFDNYVKFIETKTSTTIKKV